MGNLRSQLFGISDLNDLTAVSEIRNSCNLRKEKQWYAPLFLITELTQCTAVVIHPLRLINARRLLLAPSSTFCRLCLLLPGSLDRAKQ